MNTEYVPGIHLRGLQFPHISQNERTRGVSYTHFAFEVLEAAKALTSSLGT